MRRPLAYSVWENRVVQVSRQNCSPGEHACRTGAATSGRVASIWDFMGRPRNLASRTDERQIATFGDICKPGYSDFSDRGKKSAKSYGIESFLPKGPAYGGLLLNHDSK